MSTTLAEAKFENLRSTMNSEGEFSVVLFFCTNDYEYEARRLDAESAVKLAHDITKRVCCRIGIVDRVIITDGGDYTVWEWTFAEGVTHPKPDQPNAGA